MRVFGLVLKNISISSGMTFLAVAVAFVVFLLGGWLVGTRLDLTQVNTVGSYLVFFYHVPERYHNQK